MDEPKDERRIVVTKDGPYRVEWRGPVAAHGDRGDRARRAGGVGRGSRVRDPGRRLRALPLREVLDQALLRLDARTDPVRRHRDRGPRPDRQPPRGLGGRGEPRPVRRPLALHPRRVLPQRPDRRVGDGRGGGRPGGAERVQGDGATLPVGEARVRDPARPRASGTHVRAVDRRRARRELLDPRRDPGRVRGRDARTRCATARPCAGAGSRATSRSATARTRSTGSRTPRCRSERGSARSALASP